MDPEPNRFFLAFIIFFSFICKISYAEQYYDRQTRRYIEVGQQPATPQQFQRPKYPQRAMPTQSEIEIERQKIAKQQAIELQMEIEARNSGNKRFDPSRFHKTEDVGFY
mgnify:CR=1 FL=1|jgi:hypothetical protein